MDKQGFIKKLKEIVEIFASENFELAIKESCELKKKLESQEDKLFLENLIKVMYSASLINQQKLDEALDLLESSYKELKNFRPNYKGLKVENLIQSINQSISEIKAILKK